MKVYRKKKFSFVRFILLLIIIGCLIFLGKRGFDYYNNIKNNNNKKEIVEKAENDVLQKDPNADLEKRKKAILESFQKENPEVIAYLEVLGTSINYPVLKPQNNQFYMRRGLNKEYDIGGSIFIEAKNNKDLNDDNTVIYGHHLEIGGAMFTDLEKFRNQEFAQGHRKIRLTTNEGMREYEIFTVYGIPSVNDYRTLQFADKKDKVKYFDIMKSRSEVKLDSKDLTEDDTIITLVTCEYDYEDQRLVVQAYRKDK